MKKIFSLIALTLLLANAYGQKAVTKIKLSGFNVTLVPASEFSYTYDAKFETSEELKDDKLTLKVTGKDKDSKSSVTINYVDIESIDLENSILIHNINPLRVDRLELELDKGSTVNLLVDIKSLKANLRDDSKLGLAGTIGNAKIKLDKASMMDAYDLKTDKFSLIGLSGSAAHLGLSAKDVSLEAKSETVLTLSGKTKSFKGKAEKASRIDATSMEIDKAEVSYKGASRVIVKAKHLKSNSKL